MTVETRERFLRAIAERIAPERIEELHLFPPIRQGGKESGVAVITVRPEEEAESEAPEAAAAEGEVAEGEAAEGATAEFATAESETPGAACGPEVPDGESAESAESADAADVADGAVPVAGAELLEELVYENDAGEGEPDVPPPPPRRLTVYRASYRHTLKGPDRGKWEVEVIEEALAPAYTVDEVVRGVHERAGGDAEPERLTGEGVRAAISEEPWTATR
ncbi:MAG TPA: hypothetical protein VF041_07390 [Gemmatimonadaceae bacterium]